ncbi:MAG: DUF58 domain-containing protein [Firmicutes bacterium]|nr:DUF58 domain-containing protein [Bacillota bacterium]
MLKRNLLYLLILSIFWISALYSGEKILYFISYILLFLPVISLAFLVIIVLRYKYVENIDKRQAIRGQTVKYALNVYNEDVFFYPYIKAIFYSDHFITKAIFNDETFYLVPKKNYYTEREVYCKHIGQYRIGVKAFEFKDFFGFFRYRSKFYSENKEVRVSPRVIPLETFKVLATDYADSFKTGSRSGMEDYSEITEINRYVPGQPLKNIHWKLSAKRSELMTKKFNNPQNRCVTIYADVSNHGINDEDLFLVKDIVIESTLAILKFCIRQSIPVAVCLNDDRLTRFSVTNQYDFDAIYNKLFYIDFKSDLAFDSILQLDHEQYADSKDVMVITANLHNGLYDELVNLKLAGKNITLIYPVKDKGLRAGYAEKFIQGLKENGVHIYNIRHADEIKKVLEC